MQWPLAEAAPRARSAEMKVTREEMKAARLPLQMRDYCAHILIPLNECRRQTWYSPFKCTDLRHGYEKCQYDECAAVSRYSSRVPPPGPTTRCSRAASLCCRFGRFQRRVKILELQKKGIEPEE